MPLAAASSAGWLIPAGGHLSIRGRLRMDHVRRSSKYQLRICHFVSDLR